MELTETMYRIALKAGRAIPINSGDYVKDGLWHCGECRTKKQHRLKICEDVLTPMVLCECGRQRRKYEDYIHLPEAQRRREQPVAKPVERKFKRIMSNPDWLRLTFFTSPDEHHKEESRAYTYADKFNEMQSKGYGFILHGGDYCTRIACETANMIYEAGRNVWMVDMEEVRETVATVGANYLATFDAFDFIVFFGCEARDADILRARLGKPMCIVGDGIESNLLPVIEVT